MKAIQCMLSVAVLALSASATAFAAPLAGSPGHGTPIPVFVSIEPQAYFVERVGGDRVSVDVLIPPGKSPAVYAPTPGQMAALAKAALYFRVGVPFEEALMPKVQSMAPNTRVVDTREGIQLRAMESGEGEGGHEDHHHEAGGKDPHTWLDPMLVKQQARTMYRALSELDPQGKAYYEANYQAFASDLDRLHASLAQALAPVKGGIVFVFHPAFGYFCDAYGLTQMAVEVEGKAPKGKDLTQFIRKAKENNVRVIFVQPQFDRNAAAKIASSINGVVAPLDPLARDYFINLSQMAQSIAKALAP